MFPIGMRDAARVILRSHCRGTEAAAAAVGTGGSSGSSFDGSEYDEN